MVRSHARPLMENKKELTPNTLNWEHFEAIEGEEGLFPESVESETPDGRTIVIYRNGTGLIEVPVEKGKKVDKLYFDNFRELVDVRDEDIPKIIKLFGPPNKVILLSRSIGLNSK